MAAEPARRDSLAWDDEVHELMLRTVLFVPGNRPSMLQKIATLAADAYITGILCPTERVKVGPMGGDNPSRCFVPGTVGVISRSGGMAAECAWMVKRAGYGISTAVSVGGDALIGTTPAEALALFQQDAGTAAVVMWSEPGTAHEEDVTDFLQAGGFSKSLLVYVAGHFMEGLPEGTVFGHAASIIQGDKGRPSVKMARLRGANCRADKRDRRPVSRDQ